MFLRFCHPVKARMGRGKADSAVCRRIGLGGGQRAAEGGGSMAHHGGADPQTEGALPHGAVLAYEVF